MSEGNLSYYVDIIARLDPNWATAEAKIKEITDKMAAAGKSASAADINAPWTASAKEIERVSKSMGDAARDAGQKVKSIGAAFDLSFKGASAAQLNLLREPLEALVKAKTKLDIAFSSKGQDYNIKVRDKARGQSAIDILGERMSQMDGGLGTLSIKGRTKGSLDDLNAAAQLIQEQLNAAKPQKPVKAEADPVAEAREKYLKRRASESGKHEEAYIRQEGLEARAKRFIRKGEAGTWADAMGMASGAQAKKAAEDAGKEEAKLAKARERAAKATAAAAAAEEKRKGEPWDMMRAGAFRRGLSSLAGQALPEGPVGSMMAGMLGALGSSLTLPIAWAVGNAIMSLGQNALRLPGDVQKENATMAEEVTRRQWNFKDKEGAETSEDLLTGAHSALYRTFQGTGMNMDQGEKNLTDLTTAMHGDVVGAYEKITQLYTIAKAEGKDPTALMHEFVGVHEHGTMAEVGSFIYGNPELNKQFRGYWEKTYPHGNLSDVETEAQYKNYLGSNKISPEMLDNAMHNTASDRWDIIENLRDKGAGKGYLGGEGGLNTYYFENRAAQHKFLDYAGVDEKKMNHYGDPNYLKSPLPGAYGVSPIPYQAQYYGWDKSSVPGIRGDNTPLDVSQERMNTGKREYQVTSITGLVDTMQQMLSGGPDFQSQTANSTERAAKSLERIEANMKGGRGGFGGSRLDAAMAGAINNG